MWFKHALTEEQIAALYVFESRCRMVGLAWRERLFEEVVSTKPSVLEPLQLSLLKQAYWRVGSRIVEKKPSFFVGDGVNYKNAPATVVAIEPNKVFVRFDKWHAAKIASGDNRVLFEPQTFSEEDLPFAQCFSRRKDGEFRLVKTRENSTLGLGRFVK